MSKHRVAVLKVVSQRLSVTTAAAECGMSRGHLHRLLRRYREGGLDALERRSRTNPRRTPDALRARIVELRTELTADGFDGGPVTIAWHTGEILSTHRIEPDKGYWRNTRRDPGRWPGSRATR